MEVSNLEKNSMDNELFLSLKLHIDSQNKLNQLYQCRIRSYERFRKYCRRVAQHGDGTNVKKFNLDQFQNEYNRFDKNYRYFRKRIRKLRKETKSSLSTRYQNPYDALHELFAKIECLEKSTNTKKSEEKCLTTNQTSDNSLSNANDKPDDRPLSVSQNSCQIKILKPPSSSSVSCKNVNNFSVATPELIQSHFKCFVEGCGRMFVAKSFYLNHLFEHSTKNNDKNPVTTSVIKPAKTIGALSCERIRAKQAICATPSTSSNAGNVNPKVQPENKKSAKKVVQKIQSPIKKPAYKVGSTRLKIQFPKEKPANKDGNVVSQIQSSNKNPVKKVVQKIQSPIKKPDNNVGKVVPNRQSAIEKPKVAPQNNTTKRVLVYPADALATIYRCDFPGCKYIAADKSCFSIHQIKHSDRRPFQCDQCDKAFKMTGTLKSHKRAVHERVRYPCTEQGCSASLWSADSLRHHIKRVHTENPETFRCPEAGCEYSTLKIEFLRRHMTIHTNERPFKCAWPGCGKEFRLYVTWKAHILMHQNERRYKCKYPDCSYACNTTNNLRKHHLVHEKKEARLKGQNQNPQNMNSMIGQNEQNLQNLDSMIGQNEQNPQNLDSMIGQNEQNPQNLDSMIEQNNGQNPFPFNLNMIIEQL